MSDDTTPPAAEDLLSRQLLDEAIADTGRRWASQALCTQADPEVFFPPGDSPAAEARQICARCPVRIQCLAYAIAADEQHGIWGGLDPQERQALRRRLQRRRPVTARAGGSTR